MPNDILYIDDPKPGGLTFKYIQEYQEGDLIYGLARRRALFVEAIMLVHAGEKLPRVVMVDDMNNQFLGTNAPTTANQRRLGDEGAGPDYNPNATLGGDGALFHAFLRDKVKSKWQPGKNRGIDKVNQRVKSASKSGILWTTTQRKKKIHFILDGLDMEAVAGKLDIPILKAEGRKTREDPSNKSITGCELRWLYRNRNNREIMSRVVFWENDRKLGHAPWEDPRWKASWDNYKPKSEQDSAIVSFMRQTFLGSLLE